MKSRLFTVSLALSVSVFCFVQITSSSVNAMSTVTSTATTTTTTTPNPPNGVMEQIQGTLPFDTSGLTFDCEADIQNGIRSMTDSTITIPNSFVSSFTGDVFNTVAMSMGVNKLVQRVVNLIVQRASGICSQMAPLISDPSGQESSSVTELGSILGENSDYVNDLSGIATQMQTLTASLSSGTLTQADGQNLLDQFQALQDQQLDILEDMDDEMTQLSDDHAVASGTSPATVGQSNSSTLTNCTEVIYADPANPTAAEIATSGTYMYCQPSVTGVCCVSSCDATVTFASPGNPTETESDLYDSYSVCLPNDAIGTSYCCFN